MNNINEPLRKKARRATSELESDSPLTSLSSSSGATISGGVDGIEEHIRDALKGITALRQEVEDLRLRNAELQNEMARLHEAQDASFQPKRGKRGGMSMQALKAQVKRLNDENAKLEKEQNFHRCLARGKDKRRIRELKMKEIEKDAAELEDEVGVSVDEVADKMPKLLRRFFDLMITPSIEEKEECAVCLEEMTMQTARSLPCQHVFCALCLPKIENNTCPTCREPFSSIEDTEAVYVTATQQWDALLEVAMDWARIDKHGGNDEPEDTDEEETPFIDDGDFEPSSAASEISASVKDEGKEQSKKMDEDDVPLGLPSVNGNLLLMEESCTPSPEHSLNPRSSEADAPMTPKHQRTLSYHESPRSVKRKRLEELVKQRRLR